MYGSLLVLQKVIDNTYIPYLVPDSPVSASPPPRRAVVRGAPPTKVLVAPSASAVEADGRLPWSRSGTHGWRSLPVKPVEGEDVKKELVFFFQFLLCPLCVTR